MMISPQQIKDLRDRTGIAVGKCKEALVEAKGDMELAIANLRKQGMATAVKKEGRATNEGKVAFAETDKVVAIVEVNAETDFVVKNERFQQFVENIAEEVATTNAKDLETFRTQKYSKDKGLTIEEFRAGTIQAIGENIQIRRLKTLQKNGQKTIGTYSHLGGKMGTLVEIEGSNSAQDLAKDIAMHIAAAAPEFVDVADIPKELIEKEKEIARDQVKGKPENIVGKIVDGKLAAFYDSVCLVRQKFIRDDSKTINDLLKESGKPLKITSFLRWSVGE